MKSIFKFSIILIKIYIILLIKNIKNNSLKLNSFKNKNIIYRNKIKCLKNLSFDIFLINHSFSLKFEIAKLEYNIGFYDAKNNSIIPSYLTRYHNLHILCITKDKTKNIRIFSIPTVDKNKYFKCIEYFQLNVTINFGISLYIINNYIEYFRKFFFKDELINYNNFIYLNDSEYEPCLQLNKYKILQSRIKRENLLLKKSYYKIPKFKIKFVLALKKCKWYYNNIFDFFFCFCISSNRTNCLYNNINQKCKYYLYLYIIDNNRNIYKKTDYLFSDFSSPETAPGEAFLIFNEMNKQNLSVHYMTKREDVYKISLNYNLSSKSKIIFDFQYINGNFLEKYLDIFLKLKSTISGAKIYSINNLFKNIEYITYICLGHGISYLKDFLYKDYYSSDTYNKILLPNSSMIISNAKKYGWKETNIIKIGLPRWDILSNIYNEIKPFQNQSIFIMFTWRDIKEGYEISQYYLKNIIKLINNYSLNTVLKENNITLYFCLHHMMINYKQLFIINKNIKYINQNQIIECLMKSDLIITDFSSVLFDFIIRKKPYIIYIPDSNDLDLKKIYSESYYNKINYLKKGSIFQNRFIKIEDAVEKIIYYINNNFNIDSKLKMFYNYINLKGGNNINNFINYLQNMNQ